MNTYFLMSNVAITMMIMVITSMPPPTPSPMRSHMLLSESKKFLCYMVDIFVTLFATFKGYKNAFHILAKQI